MLEEIIMLRERVAVLEKQQQETDKHIQKLLLVTYQDLNLAYSASLHTRFF